MLHKYPSIAPEKEIKHQPSDAVINAILNYSKSLEVKKISRKKVLIHLN